MSAASKLFFVHLMKTGGTSFAAMLRTAVPKERIYPNRVDDDMGPAYTSIASLRALTPERRTRIDLYSGHFPYIASQLVGEPVWTATILRHPLDRTISQLKHLQRLHDQFVGASLEEVYEDPFMHPTFIRNYQAKLFAMTREDKLETQLDVIDVDEQRLEIAIAHLEAVDVVGTHERYDEFVAQAARRGGWTFNRVPKYQVGEPMEVSDALRERILADNEMDLRFYRHAVDLVERRSV